MKGLILTLKIVALALVVSCSSADRYKYSASSVKAEMLQLFEHDKIKNIFKSCVAKSEEQAKYCRCITDFHSKSYRESLEVADLSKMAYFMNHKDRKGSVTGITVEFLKIGTVYLEKILIERPNESCSKQK